MTLPLTQQLYCTSVSATLQPFSERPVTVPLRAEQGRRQHAACYDLRRRLESECNVRKSSTAIRVTAHVIDARSGAQLWTDTYDRPGDDIFTVQDEVTDRIVSTVADKAGVLARSMMQACRDAPLDTLTAQQLIHRCWAHEARP